MLFWDAFPWRCPYGSDGMAPSSSVKWWIIVAFVIIGTLLGVYLQRFSLTEPFFKDILSTGFTVTDVNLGFADFGFRFHLRCNFGTILGGVVGIWSAR